jgi:hypothetical protein
MGALEIEAPFQVWVSLGGNWVVSDEILHVGLGRLGIF